VSCPAPATETRSQPCVTSCGDSRVVIYPPPVLVTFPGPVLSSCPQESVVGSSAVAASPGWGGFYGSRTSLGYGAAQG
ncbi:KRFJ protein, partial [Orthonyx spaldingii]|nr:KRFJ protein [Orthonyx spaldingii]